MLEGIERIITKPYSLLCLFFLLSVVIFLSYKIINKKLFISSVVLISSLLIIAYIHNGLSQDESIIIKTLFFLSLLFILSSLYQAKINDATNGKYEKEKIATWPILVRSEFTAALLIIVLISALSLFLSAPLSKYAESNEIPNPIKAPWFLLFIQELLEYFPPWIAGITIPILIVLGLMAIPYIDRSSKVSLERYSLRNRKLATYIFLFCFISLWLYLTVQAGIFRGRYENLYGLSNKSADIKLSKWFWTNILNLNPPQGWFLRELPGIIVASCYYLVALLFCKFIFKKIYLQIGRLRWLIFAFLLITALGVVTKIILFFLFGLRYIIYIPELQFYL